MYRCNLKIFTVGLAQEAVATLRRAAPLERFKHFFKELEAEVVEPFAELTDAAVIFDEESGMTAQSARLAAGSKNICIMCAKEPSKLPADTLALLDDVWPKPLSQEMAAFCFARLQKRLKTEKDLWMANTYLNDTIETLPDMIWYKEINGIHLKVNEAFCGVVKKPKSDVEGFDHCHIWNVSHELFDKGVFSCQKSDNETIEKRRTTVSEEKVMKDDSLHILKTYKSPVISEDGKSVLGTVGIARDVTIEYKYRDQILHMAHTDYLTGFANRRYMYEYMEETRGGGGLTVLFCDIDSFKRINDEHGHLIGDAAIIAVAHALAEVFKDGFFVRLGGDEFFVILRGERPLGDIKLKMKEINERLINCIENVSLSLSAGVAYAATSDASLEELMNKSDIALYKAKHEGKGCCCTS